QRPGPSGSMAVSSSKNVTRPSWRATAPGPGITPSLRWSPTGPVGGRPGLDRPGEPQRAAQAAGPGARPGQREPLPVGVCRARRVDVHVAVAVARLGGGHGHPLQPAVHARDRVGLHGERQVLVDAGVGPPDPLRVGVVAGEGTDAVAGCERPAAAVTAEADDAGGPALVAR